MERGTRSNIIIVIVVVVVVVVVGPPLTQAAKHNNSHTHTHTDREAQRAIRERQRQRTEQYEREIRELKSQRPYLELQAALRQKEAVEAELADVRRCLAAIMAMVQPILARSAASGMSPNFFLFFSFSVFLPRRTTRLGG